jgi:acetyltransferase-like isoleucine patch superfamily enzyme
VTEQENHGIESLKYNNDDEYLVDFTTSSAISKVGVKFLIIYIPIFWFSGLLIAMFTYIYTWLPLNDNPLWWIVQIACLPGFFLAMYFLFILSCVFFSKLFLILINLIHKPKEGVFLAEIGDTDFDFWCLRTEVKKLVLWLMNNCPVPLVDTLGFRWFGMKLDFSSHLYDAWCDAEFVKFGRQVTIGQGATVMSSMVVGKYLIIRKIILDDYVVIGGQAVVAPGTIIGKDTVIGAMSVTRPNQILEEGWIYMGVPPRKIKANKYAESQRDIIIKKDVDNETKYEVEHEVNIDEDKKDLV